MEAVTHTDPLGDQSTGRLMVEYSAPAVIALAVNSLYNIVGQIFIGQWVADPGNAATTIILPLIFTPTKRAGRRFLPNQCTEKIRWNSKFQRIF